MTRNQKLTTVPAIHQFFFSTAKNINHQESPGTTRTHDRFEINGHSQLWMRMAKKLKPQEFLLMGAEGLSLRSLTNAL